MNPEDERRTLTATWLDTLASGTILIGLVTPLAALVHGSAVVAPSWPLASLAGFGCLGIAAHQLTRRVLGRPKE